jgi:cytochrome c oxidase assembly factor CtaG
VSVVAVLLAPLAAALHLGEFLPPLVACGLYLFLYARRAGTLAARDQPIVGWRAVSFAAGALLVTVVQLPPLDELADKVLVAHMLQHILIGDLASLLIVLGLTGPMLQPLLQIRPTRPLRRLASPLVALVLWAFDLYVWHVPLLYQAAIRHDLIHALEHACLLWFGVLLWLALLGPLPKPRWFGTWARLGYVAGVRFLGALLANLLIWAQTLFYPVYRASDAARGLNPVSDQNIAGATMMIEQILLTVILLAWLFLRAAGQEEDRQALLDLTARQGIPLSEQRATLAANAGTLPQLREQLLAHTPEPPGQTKDRSEQPQPRTKSRPPE